MKIYCFGNEFLENDNMAKQLADSISIENVELIKCDSPDKVVGELGDKVILDVVADIKDVIVIKDIDQLKADPIMSMHDFDLGYFLKLMNEMNEGFNVTIIGVPMKGDFQKIKMKVTETITSLLSKNETNN